MSDNHAPGAEPYERSVRRILWLTLGLNVLVCLIKAVVGFASGSLAIIADAVHSLTDSLNNVMGLLIMRWATPKPDHEHPYGHLKFEALGALGIAAMLGIACFEVLKSAVERLLEPSAAKVEITPLSLALLALVLAVNIFVAVYERRAATRLKSNLLLADAQQTFGDIWVTLGVIIGAAGVWITGWWWIDVALSVPVAIAVLWSGWTVVRSNVPWLVDETAIQPAEIEAIATSIGGVVDCHAIHSRGLVGRQVFIEMHLTVSTQDLDTAHRITEQIEQKLAERYGPIEATIHVEPAHYAELGQ